MASIQATHTTGHMLGYCRNTLLRMTVTKVATDASGAKDTSAKNPSCSITLPQLEKDLPTWKLRDINYLQSALSEEVWRRVKPLTGSK
jgi:hypothetical protein